MRLQQFIDLRDQYHATAFVGQIGNTVQRSQQCLDHYEDFLYRTGEYGEDPSLEDINIYAKWVEWVLANRKRQGASLLIYYIKRFLKWSVAAGLLPSEPSKTVRVKRFDPPPSRPAYTMEEYVKLRDAAEGDLKWMIVAAWHTGMSRVDICRLRLDEIDLNNWCIVKPRSKTKIKCVIPIESGSEFHDMLMQKIRDADLNHPGNDPANGAYYVCPALAMRYSNVYSSGFPNEFQELQKKAGVDKRKSFHSFRVSFCSMLANGNVNIGLACKMAGHSNPMTFVKKYTKVSPRALHEVLAEARRKQLESSEEGVFL